MASYFHATWEDLADQIENEGLKPGWDGCVYLCDSIEDINKLMGWRLFQRFDGEELHPELGLKFPKLTQFKTFVIFEVDLDPEEVEESFDHSAAFFEGARAWTIEREIDPSEIVNRYTMVPAPSGAS